MIYFDSEEARHLSFGYLLSKLSKEELTELDNIYQMINNTIVDGKTEILYNKIISANVYNFLLLKQFKLSWQKITKNKVTVTIISWI